MRISFTEFVEARGWKYREEYVPAGEYEDPETGEVEAWDTYNAQTIYRQEVFGGVVVFQQCDVSEVTLAQGEHMWQLLIDVGNEEFERRLNREKARRLRQW